MFTRLCHNPLHYAWTGDTTEKNIISLCANGLGKVINVFRAIEVERGERRRNITNCCSLCLMYCCEKGILKRKFMKKITPQVIVKVSKFFICIYIPVQGRRNYIREKGPNRKGGTLKTTGEKSEPKMGALLNALSICQYIWYNLSNI